MINRYRLAFQFTSLLILGVAGLGASGCTVTATVSSDSCGTDSSVNCSASGTTGYTCPADQAPDDTDSTLVCSLGTDNGDGTASYCCGTAVAGTFGCAADSTLACVSGTTGESCFGGALPDSSSQICSDGTSMTDGSIGYCCAPFSGGVGTCAADPSVTGCQYPSYGVSCASGDVPTTYDASLVCSNPTASGGEDLYCCTYGTASTATCTSNSSLSCVAGSAGFSCPAGSSAPASDGSCSIPVTDPTTGDDDYCCLTTLPTSCTLDDSLVCVAGSWGFTCAAGDSPDASDPTLVCSAPTSGTTTDSYCCTSQ
jgi:hypothetical protein